MYGNVLRSYLKHILQEAFLDLWGLDYLPSITTLIETTFRTSLTKNLGHCNCLFSTLFTPSNTTNSRRRRTIAVLFMGKTPVSGSTNIIWTWVCVCSVTQSCLTFRSPVECSLPGSSAHGIFLEWVAIFYCTGSSWPRDWTCIFVFPALAARFFITGATQKALNWGQKGNRHISL